VKRLQADTASKLPELNTPREGGMDTTHGSLTVGRYRPLVSPKYLKASELASTGVQMKIAHRYLPSKSPGEEDLQRTPEPTKKDTLAQAASTKLESARGHESPIMMVRSLVNN
jgi:hypothetical protein